MKQFSNRYIILYSSLLVAVVAVVLSVVATSLRPLQQRNIAIERHKTILKAAGVTAEKQEVEEIYSQTVIEHIDTKGDTTYIYKHGADRYTIIPMRGRGLWGAIWGYIAIDSSYSVAGVVFDHASETPGLGGEIASEDFCRQFIGKKVVDEDGTVRAIAVKKNANRNSPYEVDAISGGTMTSNGVNEMIGNALKEKPAINK